MGDGLEFRLWYRLHLLTWILLLLVGGSVVVENVIGMGEFPDTYYSTSRLRRLPPLKPYPPYDLVQHGWPLISFQRDNSFVKLRLPERNIYSASSRWPFDKAKILSFNYLYLGLNILVILVILLATIFTTESYLRRQEKWHQFSLQFILASTTFIALLLANYKYDLVRWQGYFQLEYIPFFFIAIGLWCVFWTGLRLIGLGVGRVGGGAEDG